jgi:hypothetical protein
VKEALQDAALARKPGKGQLFVWFIDPSIADEKGMKVLKSFLEENGIIVITDTESLRVLKTLDGAYRSRYGLDLIESVADWYGISKDAEVRAAFRRAVDSGEIYNFIPDWPKPKQARLDLALQGFAEDSSLAVRLRDFVKRNWDLIAQVSGVAAKLAFDEWCRRNPPRSPEEAQLRQLVGRALDAYNVGVAALGEFRTALGFVRALKAAAEGAGVGAALAAATAGVSLLITALAWYHDWWIDAHTTYQLSRAVGGRYVVFTIKRPEGLFGGERLVVTVDGRELMSVRVDRAPDEANPRQACFVEGLFGWCVSKSACSGSVCVECQSATLNNPHAECTVVVFERKTEPVTEKYDRGSYALVCTFAVENTYKWTWRVRIGYLGLAEAQAPARSLESSERTPWAACRIERPWWWSWQQPYSGFSRSYSSPSSGSRPSSASSGSSSTAPGGYRPAGPRYVPDTDW